MHHRTKKKTNFLKNSCILINFNRQHYNSILDNIYKKKSCELRKYRNKISKIKTESNKYDNIQKKLHTERKNLNYWKKELYFYNKKTKTLIKNKAKSQAKIKIKVKKVEFKNKNETKSSNTIKLSNILKIYNEDDNLSIDKEDNDSFNDKFIEKNEIILPKIKINKEKLKSKILKENYNAQFNYNFNSQHIDKIKNTKKYKSKNYKFNKMKSKDHIIESLIKKYPKHKLKDNNFFKKINSFHSKVSGNFQNSIENIKLKNKRNTIEFDDLYLNINNNDYKFEEFIN